ncbi:MAG: hypothetical protein HY302_02035 [Opitutae bacterium]|nr:hypothetical protein [Opitutae bacterium]
MGATLICSKTTAIRRCSLRAAVAKTIAADSLSTNSQASTSGKAQLLFEIFPAHFAAGFHLGVLPSQHIAIGFGLGAQPALQERQRLEHCVVGKLLHPRPDFGEDHARKLARAKTSASPAFAQVAANARTAGRRVAEISGLGLAIFD